MESKGTPLSSAERLTIIALVAAAAGFGFQILFGGVQVPTIPPGLIILLVPAGLVAFGRWRWTPVTAVVAGLFLTIGLFLSGSGRRLHDSSQTSGFIGLWIQCLAQVVALVGLLLHRAR
jgi:hypothetical protein